MRLRIHSGSYPTDFKAFVVDGDNAVELPQLRSVDIERADHRIHWLTTATVTIKFFGGEISLPKTMCDFIQSEDSKIKAVKAEIDTITTKLAALKEQVSKIGSNG